MRWRVLVPTRIEAEGPACLEAARRRLGALRERCRAAVGDRDPQPRLVAEALKLALPRSDGVGFGITLSFLMLSGWWYLLEAVRCGCHPTRGSVAPLPDQNVTRTPPKPATGAAML